MSKYVLPIEWEASGGIILEAAAEKAVRSDNNLLVIAGPGAGKTELLAQKTDYLFQTNLCSAPRRILAISFKKDAAENLKDRIGRRYGDEYANRFSSLTYDAFAKKLLDQFRCSLPQKYIPQPDYLVEDDSIINDVFDHYVPGFNSWRKMAKDQKISELLYSSPDREIWNTLLKGEKGIDPCLTFKMITILAITLIKKNPKIREMLQKTYSHVFLDEFQDTTDLQYSLMKSCFLNGESLITAVGDNKQRIMEWAGARKTIFNDFQKDFYSDKVSLIMNHRSAPRLVDLQKKMYNSLGEKELEAVHSEKWDSDDGEIKLFYSTDEDEEAIKLVNDIATKIRKGVPEDEICILVKQTAERYSSGIIALLKERDIRARIEIKFQDLLKQSIVSLILNIFKVSLKIQKPIEWENLESFWIKRDGLDENSSKHNFDYMQNDLRKIIDYCRKQLDCELNEDNFKYLVMELVKLIEKENIYQIYPEYKQGNYLELVLNEFIGLFWGEYAASNSFKDAIRNFQGENTISIMTIHKSKGLEYEAVYFVGLEDSAFWNFRNQPDADRSAFFVAISRAKKYLAFSYCSNRASLKNAYNPSGDQRNTNINEFFELLMIPGVAIIES